MRAFLLTFAAIVLSIGCGGNVVVDSSTGGTTASEPCPGFTQYCDQGGCLGAALCNSGVCTDPTQASNLACFAALPLDAGCNALDACVAK